MKVTGIVAINGAVSVCSLSAVPAITLREARKIVSRVHHTSIGQAPLATPIPEVRRIAIEAVSHVNNALALALLTGVIPQSLGMRVLQPGETLVQPRTGFQVASVHSMALPSLTPPPDHDQGSGVNGLADLASSRAKCPRLRACAAVRAAARPIVCRRRQGRSRGRWLRVG